MPHDTKFDDENLTMLHDTQSDDKDIDNLETLMYYNVMIVGW